MNPNNPEDTTRESSDQESCANTRGLEAPQMKKGGFRDIGCITWSLVAVALLVGILLPSVEKVREAANRAKSQDQLMQIAFAMLNSASNNKDETLPAVAIYDRDGNPLLSWRSQPFFHSLNSSSCTTSSISTKSGTVHTTCPCWPRCPRLIRCPATRMTPTLTTKYFTVRGHRSTARRE